MDSDNKKQTILDQCIFLCCDVQEKVLSYTMKKSEITLISVQMIDIAIENQIPVIVSVQNTKSLGHTVQEVQQYYGKYEHITEYEKISFSMLKEETIKAKVIEHQQSVRKTQDVVIWGIFTEACVMKSSLDLIQMGFNVWLIQEGLSTLANLEHEAALQRLQMSGCRLISVDEVKVQLGQYDRILEISQARRAFSISVPTTIIVGVAPSESYVTEHSPYKEQILHNFKRMTQISQAFKIPIISLPNEALSQPRDVQDISDPHQLDGDFEYHINTALASDEGRINILVYGVIDIISTRFYDICECLSKREDDKFNIMIVVDAITSVKDEQVLQLTLAKVMNELKIMPTTVESFVFEFIDTYKDDQFKTILGLAKDRPTSDNMIQGLPK